jgi:transcriptional regulator with GAF, ATPase, and Fis domain
VLRVRVDQLLGKPLLVFVDPTEHGALRCQLGGAVRDGMDFRRVVTLRPVRAEPVNVELQATVSQDLPGGPVEVTWLILTAGDTAGPSGEDVRHGLANALVELSRVPLHDRDLKHVLVEAARICAGALGEEASVSITLGPTTNPEMVATSQKTAQMVDGAQMLADEGPCVDAWRTASEIWSQDLHSDERWQRLAGHLAGTNVGGAVALPFGIGEKPVGTLNIYRDAGREVGPGLAEAAHLLSGALAALVYEMETRAELETLAEQLSTALKSRATIDLAKGIVMARRGCGPDEAFAHLVRISSTTNTKVRQVAADMVAMTQGEPRPKPRS